MGLSRLHLGTVCLALCLTAATAGHAAAQSDTIRPRQSRRSLLPLPTPDSAARTPTLREINQAPAINPLADTTKLGQQPDSLREAGVDRIQPSRGEGAPADSGKKRWPVPGRAALFSLVLPASGQVYNRDFWKVPLVAAALGVPAYFYIENSRIFREFQDEYRDRIRYPNGVGRPLDNPDRFPNRSTENVRANRDIFRRNRDYSTFFFFLAWALNGVEAYVAAHLKHFTVSEELTLRLGPATMPNYAGGLPGAGLQLTLTLP